MTALRAALLRRERDADAGFTLVELLAAMTLFGLFLAIFATAVTGMFTNLRKQQGRAADLDDVRAVLQQLDRQVRYANAVSLPGDGTDGNAYVEWRTSVAVPLPALPQQTCTQLRLNRTTNQLQLRTWVVPASPTTPATPSAWLTRAWQVYDPATGTPFVPVLNAPDQQLSVAFTSRRGNPPTSTAAQVTLTARNTSSSDSSPATCTEVPRS